MIAPAIVDKNKTAVASNGNKYSENNVFPKFLINPASWFAVGAMLNPVLKEANNTKKSKPPETTAATLIKVGLEDSMLLFKLRYIKTVRNKTMMAPA